MPVPFLAPLLGSMLGTSVAAGAGAAAAAGGAAAGGGVLSSLLGAGAAGGAASGIGGLLSSAVPSALGAGLATAAAGGDENEILQNALGFGVGSMAMPGLQQGLSSATKPAAEGVANAMAPDALAQAPETSLRPQARPSNLGSAPAEAEAAAAGGGGGIEGMDAMKAMGQASQNAEPEVETAMSSPAALTPAPMNLASGPQGNGDRLGGGAPAAPQPVNVAGSAAPTTVPIVGAPQDERMRAAEGGLMSAAAQRNMKLPVDQLPNLSSREEAYKMAMRARNMYAVGGFVEGPGTGTSDDIDSVILQNGEPVQKALLSDGEFVMTAKAVEGAGGGDRGKGAANMYKLMQEFEKRMS